MLQTLSIPPAPSPEFQQNAHSLRDILVYQSDGAASQAAFDYAQMLAAVSGGGVAGLTFAVIPLPIYGGHIDMSPDIWIAAQDAAKEEAAAQWERLKPRFDNASAPAELRRSDIIEGDESRMLALHGRFADVIIVGWTAEDAPAAERAAFAGALFDSGRPVIAVPASYKTVIPKRALIAWTATREAARAAHEALPLLKGMESARVLTVDDGSSDVRLGGVPGADIAHHLARHNVNVDVKFAPSGGLDISEAILNEASYFGADLVVLGGYGHSRAREWMFGGVTRDILSQAKIPLFMSH